MDTPLQARHAGPSSLGMSPAASRLCDINRAFRSGAITPEKRAELKDAVINGELVDGLLPQRRIYNGVKEFGQPRGTAVLRQPEHYLKADTLGDTLDILDANQNTITTVHNTQSAKHSVTCR